MIRNKLAFLYKLTKQSKIQTTLFLLRYRKKVSISMFFQKASLGWEISPIINRRTVWNKNVLDGKKIGKLIRRGTSIKHLRGKKLLKDNIPHIQCSKTQIKKTQQRGIF